MNEKEIGDALLKWDATKPVLGRDPREMTCHVLDRDRRRVRWLTIVSAIFWLLALVGVLTIFIAGGFAFPYIQHLVQESQAKSAVKLTAENAPFLALAKITAVNIVVMSGSMTSLVCAGFGTLVLIRTSRNATLRQINAGLFEISEQLKHLRSSLAK